MRFEETKTEILPKGEYIVDDLCYLFEDDDLWSDFCDHSNNNLSISGIPLYWHYTQYGDGAYSYWEIDKSKVVEEFGFDKESTYQKRSVFPVDSGSIGIISVDILEKLGKKRTEEDLMGLKTVEIDSDFKPMFEEETGVFDFGGFEIYTGEK